MSNPFFVNGAFRHHHGKAECKESPRLKRRQDTLDESPPSVVRNNVFRDDFGNGGFKEDGNIIESSRCSSSGVYDISMFGYQDDTKNERYFLPKWRKIVFF